jgi:protein transport protein SEC61 subunit gamma-like protein
MAEPLQELLEVPAEFTRDGLQFIRRCTKPDLNEFIRLCQAVGVGFVLMGTVGFITKLIHIPLNNVLVGSA